MREYVARKSVGADFFCPLGRQRLWDQGTRIREKAYRTLLAETSQAMLDMNRLGNIDAWHTFWLEISRIWLTRMNLEPQLAGQLHECACAELMGSNSSVFRPYTDVVPLLSELKTRELKLAVISNWDVTLEPCLRAHYLTDFFDGILLRWCLALRSQIRGSSSMLLIP